MVKAPEKSGWVSEWRPDQRRAVGKWQAKSQIADEYARMLVKTLRAEFLQEFQTFPTANRILTITGL
jgi:hypothetical protein